MRCSDRNGKAFGGGRQKRKRNVRTRMCKCVIDYDMITSIDVIWEGGNCTLGYLTD